MKTEPFVSWSSKYDTGFAHIDEQHKLLVRVINEFYDGLQNRQADRAVVFKRAAHQAVEYVKNHFAAEEKWMRDTGFPGYQKHCAEHALFAQQLLGCVKRFDRNDSRPAFEFVKFLAGWLMSHIAVEDNNFRFHLKPHQTPPPSAAAPKA